MRKRLLFLMQLPPPYHGTSIINSYIKESKAVNQEFDITYFDSSSSLVIDKIGKFSFNKVLQVIPKLFQIVRLCAQHHYDKAYITLTPHGFGFWRDSIFILIIKVFGVKCIFHLHGKGIDQNVEKGFFKKRYYQWIFKNVEVICLSSLLVNDILLFKSIKERYILPNGIPIEKSSAENPEIFTIIFLSHLLKEKGVMTLLKAAKVVKDAERDFQINLIGEWQSSEFKDLCIEFVNNEELSNNLTFMGPVYGDKKYEYLGSSHVFVLPTYFKNECFPLSILEAMRCGIPVISSFEGAIPEIVKDGENGFLVEAQDYRTLADRIMYLIDNENDRKSMGDQARADFENNYTFEKFENGLVSILKSSLQK